MSENCTRCDAVRDGSHSSYCRACFAAYMRERYQRTREQEVARAAAWNRANPERVAANMRAHRARDPEGERQYLRTWRAENADKVRAHDAKKHARRRGAKAGGHVTAEEWRAIQAKHGHRCVYCNKKPGKLTMDHIVPLALGGAHEAANIAPACNSRNSRKGATSPAEFAARMGRLYW